MASSIVLSDNGVTSGSAGIKSTGGNDGVLLLQTTTASGTATTAVLIDNVQNVGVGVTPNAWGSIFQKGVLQIGNYGGYLAARSDSANQIYLGVNNYYNGTNWIYTNTAVATSYDQSNGQHEWKNAVSGTAGTSISWTQAMTLDVSGNLLVGSTSQINSGKFCVKGDLPTYNLVALQATNSFVSGTYFLVAANSSGSVIGGIQQASQTTISFPTSSDARLKEDKGVATDTSVIDNTIVHDFTWKLDGKTDRGVFAQEAYEVKPLAVGIGKDDLTEDGNLAQPWNVDYSKYVPDLIVHAQQLKKQVQEQQSLIQSLTDRLTALEGAAK